MSTEIESSWENARLLEEIYSLRAKLADAEAKLASAEPVDTSKLQEAYMYGQFADDFDYPLVKPIRKAIRDLLDIGPLYTTPQPAPDVQAAVAAALAKAADELNLLVMKEDEPGYKSAISSAIALIRAIPRDTSALDEYKADIKRLGEALNEAIQCNWLDDDMPTDIENEIINCLTEIEAKYNL